MNITIDIIKEQHRWLYDLLPLEMRMLPITRGYFVVFYDVDSSSTAIGPWKIRQSMAVPQLHKYLHKARQASNAEFFAAFNLPLSSESAALYQFLKTIVYTMSTSVTLQLNLESLAAMYADWRMQDTEIAQKAAGSISQVGYADVWNQADLRAELSRYVFRKPLIDGMLTITDLIHEYTQRVFGVGFYGGKLKGIAKAVASPIGGFFPEAAGSMRYMVVGEKADSSRNDPSLIEAKKLLRSGILPNAIHKLTGWYMNPHDGKWRKRISDNQFQIKKDKISGYELGGRSGYEAHKDLPHEAVYRLYGKDLDYNGLIRAGHKGSVGDIVNHPNLFAAYPELSSLPLFYLNFRGSPSRHSAGFEQTFYFSNDENPHIVFKVYDGYQDWENIMLHEMQHYIQEIEGFANGGNLWISKYAMSIGSNALRQFLLLMGQCKKEFLSTFSISKSEKILLLFADISRHLAGWVAQGKNANEANSLAYHIDHVKRLLPKAKTDPSLVKNIFDVLFGIFTIVAEVDGDSIVGMFVKHSVFDSFGAKLLAVYFENIVNAEKYFKSLQAEGWSQSEIGALVFSAYTALSGEIESRHVQNTTTIPEAIADYFLPSSSETIQNSDVLVLMNDGMGDVPEVAAASLETIDGDTRRYIIHMKQTAGSETFLHELGHILYDYACEAGNSQKISASFSEYLDRRGAKNEFSNVEEFFVENWLCWVARAGIAQNITDNLMDTDHVRRLDEFIDLDPVIDAIMMPETSSIKLDADSAINYVSELLDLLIQAEIAQNKETDIVAKIRNGLTVRFLDTESPAKWGAIIAAVDGKLEITRIEYLIPSGNIGSTIKGKITDSEIRLFYDKHRDAVMVEYVAENQ